MTALTVSINLRRPLVEVHANRADAMWHAATVASAVGGKIPMSVIGPDGEYVFVYTPPSIIEPKSFLAALRPSSPRVGVPAAVRHQKDADCTVDPATGCCIGCGVDHSTACQRCYGRGFHNAGCPEVR